MDKSLKRADVERVRSAASEYETSKGYTSAGVELLQLAQRMEGMIEGAGNAQMQITAEFVLELIGLRGVTANHGDVHTYHVVGAHVDIENQTLVLGLLVPQLPPIAVDAPRHEVTPVFIEHVGLHGNRCIQLDRIDVDLSEAQLKRIAESDLPALDRLNAERERAGQPTVGTRVP